MQREAGLPQRETLEPKLRVISAGEPGLEQLEGQFGGEEGPSTLNPGGV